ncbi:hypothetical protein [Arthrobacter sp. H-02-3]|uniref:hypothetical protein n=1 Tax=Arthrobacter sp. H-02-3 TaxID=2703675 RepID=UPI00137B8FE2|nr:hypothetical protein [Arthrobacter sp. H-02-3]
MTKQPFKRSIRQIKASAEAVKAVGKAMCWLAAGVVAIIEALQIIIQRCLS